MEPEAIRIAVGERTVSRGWLTGQPDAAQRLLAYAYQHHITPYCLCRGRPGIPMHVRRRQDGYVLCKNPDSGPLHAPLCLSHAADPRLSGRAVYAGAIVQHPDGTTSIRPDFSLRLPAAPRTAAVPPACAGAPAAATGALQHRISLRGVIYLLWETARYHIWHPGMRGKRNYPRWRHHLLEAAAAIRLGSEVLCEVLYIPGDFRCFDEDLGRLSRQGARRVLLLGRVKAFRSAPFGWAAALDGAPRSQPLYLAAPLFRQLASTWPGSCTAAGELDGAYWHWLIATVRLTERGHLQAGELAGLRTNHGFIPVESAPERQIADQLIKQGRAFSKPLRYEADEATFPDFLLTDCGPQPTRLPTTGKLV